LICTFECIPSRPSGFSRVPIVSRWPNQMLIRTRPVCLSGKPFQRNLTDSYAVVYRAVEHIDFEHPGRTEWIWSASDTFHCIQSGFLSSWEQTPSPLWGTRLSSESIWKSVLSETKRSLLRLGAAALGSFLERRLAASCSDSSKSPDTSGALQNVAPAWILLPCSSPHCALRGTFCVDAGFYITSPLILSMGIAGSERRCARKKECHIVLLTSEADTLVVVILILLGWLERLPFTNCRASMTAMRLGNIQLETHRKRSRKGSCGSVDDSLWNWTLLNSWPRRFSFPALTFPWLGNERGRSSPALHLHARWDMLLYPGRGTFQYTLKGTAVLICSKKSPQNDHWSKRQIEVWNETRKEVNHAGLRGGSGWHWRSAASIRLDKWSQHPEHRLPTSPLKLHRVVLHTVLDPSICLAAHLGFKWP